MDVVYIVKAQERNEELRHSLRSLTNLPHDQVWLAGYCPAWADVQHIPTTQAGSKQANALGNLLAACRHPDVSDTFAVFNDDFFLTAPVTDVPVLHRGPVADVIAEMLARFRNGSPYITAMQDTFHWLRRIGITEPLCYDLHLPMPIQRAGMLEAVERAERDGVDVSRFHNRTAYGNLHSIGGDYSADVKIYTSQTVTIPQPFVSTNDSTFASGFVGRVIRRMYPDPSPYEQTATPAHAVG